MEKKGFNISVFGAAQYYISKVSKRDPNLKHTKPYDKLYFVKEYIKNNLEEAKNEYLEVIKIIEKRKINKEKLKEKENKRKLKNNTHICHCKYCTHKQRRKKHICDCEYCVINNKNVLNKDDNKTDIKIIKILILIKIL